MKPSEEQRLGQAIIGALERIRQCMCQTATATQWHLDKAASLIRKPKLLERAVPHLEGEQAKQYLASLPAWLEEAKQQDSHCQTLRTQKETADDASRYAAERQQLVNLLLRFDFSLRSYEKLARQPVVQHAELATCAMPDSNSAPPSVLAEQECAELQQQIHTELRALDVARAELVEAHNALISKYARDTTLPIEEAVIYARHGLVKAAENFDIRRGYRFATYARWWIKTAIKERKTWTE